MTDFEFYAFWGSCLGFVLLFAMFIGVIEIIQRKKDKKEEKEADELRRAYEKRQANKKLWEQNMVESEKLFKEE